MGLIQLTVKDGQVPTKEQLQEVRAATKLSPVFASEGFAQSGSIFNAYSYLGGSFLHADEQSGIVRICTDDKEEFFLDLYSKHHGQLEVDVLKKNTIFHKRLF
jgi:hypothetical protein